MIGKRPKLKIIQSTHTTELAVRFGRKAKNLMDSPEYKEIFPTRLREDSQAAGKWETEQGGEYYAAGVGSTITGTPVCLGSSSIIGEGLPYSSHSIWI